MTLLELQRQEFRDDVCPAISGYFENKKFCSFKFYGSPWRGEERRGEERDRIGMWRAGGVVFVIVVRIHTKTGQNYINCRLENRTLLFE